MIRRLVSLTKLQLRALFLEHHDLGVIFWVVGLVLALLNFPNLLISPDDYTPDMNLLGYLAGHTSWLLLYLLPIMILFLAIYEIDNLFGCLTAIRLKSRGEYAFSLIFSTIITCLAVTLGLFICLHVLKGISFSLKQLSLLSLSIIVTAQFFILLTFLLPPTYSLATILTYLIISSTLGRATTLLFIGQQPQTVELIKLLLNGLLFFVQAGVISYLIAKKEVVTVDHS